ncbi:MAG TPA: RnfABCDGE type electron transport complex subunit D, partial [Clostridia bacterium]|nr:RnfABCDGE type electron transport complex subunit D [Clostridia bacterium]
MAKRWNASSSPHLRDDISTASIMRDVCIALLPAGLCGVWFFGLRAAVVIFLSVFSAVASEYLYQVHTKRPRSVNDWSAVVTGLLLAYNLPPTAPWWLPVIGGAIAIILIKQIFGGIGQNFMNPALGARAILMISWATLMTTTVAPQAGAWLNADTVSIATPLAVSSAMQAVSSATSAATSAATQAAPVSYSITNLLLGNVPGMLGETGKLALLLGGVYLLWRRVISWHIPVSFMATAFILFWIHTGAIYAPDTAQSALYQLLSEIGQGRTSLNEEPEKRYYKKAVWYL